MPESVNNQDPKANPADDAGDPSSSSGLTSDLSSGDLVPRVHKFLSEDLTVRISVVNATTVVDEMRSIQNSYPISTVAVGRSMVGALLMASHLKNGQELSLYFQGNGPLGRVFAEANFEGQVRGYSNHPNLQLPLNSDGQIRIGEAIGIGLLTVTHHLPGQQEPHRGTVIIRTGEVGDDIAFYLHQSHQIPSVVALGVHVNEYGLVQAAGGILIELMPGHSDELVAKIEENVKRAPPISKRLLEGAALLDIVRDYLGDEPMMELDHPYPIKYHCRCSIERVLRSVMLLGIEEIDRALSDAKPLDVACEFCGRHYEVGPEELTKLRGELYKVSLN